MLLTLGQFTILDDGHLNSHSSICLPVTSLRNPHHRFVYPYLVYCVSVRASTYLTNLNRFVILQKKVVRFISKKPFDVHTDPVFKEF